MMTGLRTWIASLVSMLVIFAGVLGGCADSSPSMRGISQHPEHGFVTLKTDEAKGASYFWGCRQVEEGLDCHRICDYSLSDSRICAPELAGEFGQVSGPTSGVVAGKYRAKLEGRDDGEPTEESGDRRARPAQEVRDEVDEVEDKDVAEKVDKEEESVEVEEDVVDEDVEEESAEGEDGAGEPGDEAEEGADEEIAEAGQEVEEVDEESQEVGEETAEAEEDEIEEEPAPEEEDEGSTEWWED